MSMAPRLRESLSLLISIFAACSMWFYVDHILVAYQNADAAAHDRPRGNLSDLYPRWLGAREVLIHHRDPYAGDVTKEIQEGYYGRALDPARANDPKDQQAFAYPLYVVFLLAPMVNLPFESLRIGFCWALAVFTGLSVWLWLRVIRWRLGIAGVAACIVFTLGSFPAAQGIKLQQLSLLVAALMAAAVACAVNGALWSSGALLALATIKPQLAWPLLLWLMVWAVCDWRKRNAMIFGFFVLMAGLLLGAEVLLPGWWRGFAHAITQYQHYTQSQSVIEITLQQAAGSGSNIRVVHIFAQLLAATAIVSCAVVVWRFRHAPASDPGFINSTALVLGTTVLVVPMYAPYNQLLLLPAIMYLIRDHAIFWVRSRLHRMAYLIFIALIGWQWLTSFALIMMYCLVSRQAALSRWSWPLFATFPLTIWTAALAFLHANYTFPASPRSQVRGQLQ